MRSIDQLTAPGVTAAAAVAHEFDVALKQNANGYVPLDVVRELQRVAKGDHPPSNNMGGTYPHPPPFFSQCEKSSACARQKAKIDWLGFTSPADVETLKLVLDMVWPGVVFSRNEKGMPGYPESCSVSLNGVQYGQMGYGAAHGKNHVSLSGAACKTLTDELIEVFYDALSLPDISATLTRIDLAFDFYRGERTFDHAVWAYEQGQFKRPRASKNPIQKIVAQLGQRGENMGRTMYVGKRGGFVMARVYEKGLEVFSKLPEELQLLSECREMDREVQAGDDDPIFKQDTWLRLEAEFRRKDDDLMLPLDMMLKRDQYFAGAYPYFASALECGDGIRPAVIKSDELVDFLAMIAAGKRSYGSLVHSMKELGFTDTEIVAHLTSGKVNNKLVRSGLLGVMRDAVAEYRKSDPDWDIPPF